MGLVRITKMERAPEGYLVARVTLEEGKTFPVHRKYGSWMQDHPERKGWMKELPRDATKKLAAKAALLEKHEKRAAVEAALAETEAEEVVA